MTARVAIERLRHAVWEFHAVRGLDEGGEHLGVVVLDQRQLLRRDAFGIFGRVTLFSKAEPSGKSVGRDTGEDL